MGNTCKTCQHDQVTQINNALTRSVSFRNIVKTYPGISIAAISRHKEKCLDVLFREVRDTQRRDLLAAVAEIRNEIDEVREQFVDNPMIRIGLIGRMFDAIDREAKLTGAFTQDAKNPTDLAQQASNLVAELTAKGVMDRDDAVAFALEQYPGAVIASESVH